MLEIGKLFHLSQVVDDLDEADGWYDRVFAPARTYRDFLKAAMRDASLLFVGDAAALEVIAIADRPGAEHSPLGKWKARNGAGLHSPAWYVDDLDATWAYLRDRDIRMTDVVGRPIETAEHMAKQPWLWTHPKDTHGSLEFARLPRFGIDVRFQAHWPATWWRDEHPLGITGPVGWTTVVGDLDAASTTYTDLLGAVLVDTPTDRQAFQIGPDTFVELAAAGESEELEAAGPGLHDIIFLVDDLDGAADHLRRVEVAHTRSDHAITVEAEHALGTPITFRPAPQTP